jgi:hypothetical protein
MTAFIAVQRNYRWVHGGDGHDTETVKAWFDRFLVMKSVFKQPGVNLRNGSEQNTEEIFTAFQRSPSKSIR